MTLLARLQPFLESLPDRRGLDLIRCSLLVFIGTWIVAQLLSFTIVAVYPGPKFIDSVFSSWSGVISAVLFAPLAETLSMRGVFWLLRKLRQGKAGLLGWSSLMWWIAHLPSDSWGIPAAMLFWIMGVLYLAFERRSTDWAMVYVSLFHLGFNALAYLLYAYMHL
jgi:membrane protease YdiL (CAAX protease family)